MNQDIKELSFRLDNMTAFLQENMVTKEELAELKSEFPSKSDFNQLQTTVDGIARIFQGSFQELKFVGERASRMEAWIMKAAGKIGVDYKP